ncbi:MAG: tRNA (adenosine(37)-N6)-threonylcarbamoyltransferase complex dimerization subunit type 1 TsaB [Acidobacteria bacterium]|nr:tRNA (adenosine(37)-N6)-threonylcarbamoyltransferase complex dimerization subunit type 1 TsaB [Acidobacteriota bacterium]
MSAEDQRTPVSTGSLILAVDTSSHHASFAIARDEKLLASLSSEAYLPHSRTFFANISTLLQLANLEIKEIDAFAAATGPGSFTGLRVGLAAVKGLAHTLGKPSIGINSIDSYALSSGIAGLVLVMIEAGREEVYCGLREVSGDGKVKVIGQDRVGTPSSTLTRLITYINENPLVIVGDGALHYRTHLETAAANAGKELQKVGYLNLSNQSWQLKVVSEETAVTIARVAARMVKAGINSEIHAYYLRPSDAELKLDGPA